MQPEDIEAMENHTYNSLDTDSACSKVGPWEQGPILIYVLYSA